MTRQDGRISPLGTALSELKLKDPYGEGHHPSKQQRQAHHLSHFEPELDLLPSRQVKTDCTKGLKASLQDRSNRQNIQRSRQALNQLEKNL